ncbi:MAG: DUF3784 domain-containing protein [Cellulosilyticaceae bacterium]
MFDLMMGVMITIPIGIIFIYLGFRIWKKEHITLIHGYHWKKVSKEDKKPYTEQMGKAMLLIGIGIMTAGIIDATIQQPYGWKFFILCFIFAFIRMHRAQKKYNGSWF